MFPLRFSTRRRHSFSAHRKKCGVTHLQCDLKGLGSAQLLIVAQSHHQHAAAVRLYGQRQQQQAGCHIIHYINLHLKEDLTLSTLTARFNLSRSYLSDRLHREVHSNLTDYVTLTRIQFAANLLRYHHYTITQAAQEVGIPDVPYFTRLFKRTMGETPSQYARKKAIEA